VQDNGVGTPTNQSASEESLYRGVPGITTDAASSVAETGAQLNGTLISLGESVSDIRFEYGTTTAYGSWIAASPASLASGTHTDTPVSATPPTLGAGITYHYRVVASVGGFDIYGADQTVTTNEMSAPGKALSFSGTNNASAPLATTETDNVTIEAWVNQSGGTGTLVYNGSDGSDGYGISLTPEVAVVCGGSGTAVSSLQLASGTWQHVAAVRESGTWKLYVNGLERTLDSNPAPVTPAGGTEIGTGFSGKIDEVRIWSVARSETQIQEYMSQSLTGGEAGLAAYYHCDHASGEILTDRTATHKDATLVNSPSWTDSSAFSTWTGSVSNDWSNAANWTDGVPGAGSTADIPSGTPTLSGTGTCGNLIIGSGASLTLAPGASLTISGDAFSHGTFSGASDSTVTYSGTAEQYVMTGSYGSLTLSNAAGFIAEGTITASGTLGLNSGTLALNGTLTISSCTLDFSGGDIDYNGHAPVVYSGTATLEYSGPGPYVTTDDEFPEAAGLANLTVGSAGGVTLHADRTLAGSLTLTNGELNADSYSLDIGADVVISGGDYVSGAGNLNVGGDWTKTGGSFDAGTGTVTFDGSTAQTIQSGGGTFNHLVVSKSGTLSLSDALDADGDLTISAGTLDAAGQTISVAGDWANAAAFTESGGSVILDGDDQMISGSTTFNNLTKNVSVAAVLTFQSGTTQTILGTLDLRGADADNRLSLLSDTDGTAWRFDPQGTWDFAWLDVKDSENLDATPLDTTATDSVTSGGNINWNVQIPVAEPGTVSATEDTRKTIVLAGTDADDALTCTVVSLPSGSLSQTDGTPVAAGDLVTDASFRVVYDPPPDANGLPYTSFRFTVNDGTYDSPPGTMTVHVTPVDDGPTVARPIADVVADEDAVPTVISLADVFADIDSDLSAIVKTVEGNTNPALITAEAEDNTLTLSYAADQSGSAEIVIMGTVDEKSAQTGFSVTVNPVDDAPVASGLLEDITVEEDADDMDISLSGIFTDTDSAGIDKSVADNSNPDLVTASAEGDTLTLGFQENQTGEAVITVQGTADGKSAETPITVIVTPADDPPTVANAIADIVVDEDSEATVIPLADVFTDIDSDVSAITKSVLTNTNPGLLSAAVSGGTLTLSYLADQHGEAVVTVQADSEGLTADHAFTVTVLAVDDPPQPAPDQPDERKIIIGEPDTLIPLSDLFYDVDNNISEISVVSMESSDSTLVEVSSDGTSLILSCVSENRVGQADVTVTVTVTSGGQTLLLTFTVAVAVAGEVYEVSGRLSGFGSGFPLSGVPVMADGTDFYEGLPVSLTAVTDENGIYSFPDLVRGDYTVTPLPEDDPGPAGLSADDATNIARASVGSSTPTA